MYDLKGKKMKRRSATFIHTIKEDGVTIFKIQGLENHPKAYKYTYHRLIHQIEQSKIKFLSTGEPLPVVRVYPSLEIH